MKKITIFLSLLILFLFTNAQKVYFVYFQADNQEKFYVRLGEKIYNSTASGYLILSNLADSTYGMHIGISGSQSPEQLFSIVINKKDKGYVIKNFGEKGWGLFDLQSFTVIMPAATNAVNIVQLEKREANPFTDLLAKAADDSTIKEKPVVLKEVERKVETPVQIVPRNEEIQNSNNDSVSIKRIDVKQTDIPVIIKEDILGLNSDTLIEKPEEKKVNIQVENKKEEISADTTEIRPVVANKAEEKNQKIIVPVVEKKTNRNPFVDEFQKSIVVKRSESSTTEGFGITFLDVTGDGSIDTIRILIPNVIQNPIVAQVRNEDLKFLDINSADTSKAQEKQEQITSVSENTKPAITEKTSQEKNNCNQVANEEDFFQLRKNMAAEISNDNMLNEAKKTFKTKCFLTEQIKNLSTLFLTDEAKYKFFDISYQYVSDIEKFPSLLSELKEEIYINRFKAILY